MTDTPQVARESAPENADEYVPFSPTPRKMSCGRCGCMALIVGLTLTVIAVVALRAFMIGRIDHDRLERLKQYDTVVLDIPKEWQTPAPLPSDEVVEFQLGFYDRVAQLNESFGDGIFGDGTSQSLFMKLRRGDAVTSAEQQTLDGFMAAFAPMMTETSSGLALPNYTADMMLYSSGTLFLPVQQFAKFSSVAALETARQGNCRAAMDIAALPMRYLKHEEPASLIFDLIQVACFYISAGTFDALAAQSDDPAALRHGLEILTSLRDRAQPGTLERWSVTDQVSILNRAAAFGYPVDLGPQTRASLTQQSADIWSGPYNEWAIKKFPASDRRHQAAKAAIEAEKEREKYRRVESVRWAGNSVMDKVLGSVLARELIGFSPGAIMSDVAVPNYVEAHTRAKAMAAAYDLARLHLAQRLAQVEGGAAPPVGPGAVAAYIQPVPEDAFSSSPLLFQAEQNRFYSVGPDKDDDKLEFIYDATNGTVSNGDLVVRKF
jgi:hypothetical protein